MDIKYQLSESLELESFSFLSYFPFERMIDSSTYPSQAAALYSEVDLSYRITEYFNLTGSYTFERVNPFEDAFRNEHRFWMQAALSSKINDLDIKNRVRYDFRFIQNRSDDAFEYLPRLRYFLGLAHPLSRKEKPVKVLGYNELFFNTFKDSSPFYSENWAFIGIGFPVNANLGMELGYLNVSWLRDDQNNWLAQHFLQMTFLISLN